MTEVVVLSTVIRPATAALVEVTVTLITGVAASGSPGRGVAPLICTLIAGLACAIEEPKNNSVPISKIPNFWIFNFGF